jgi:hypothetical protein
MGTGFCKGEQAKCALPYQWLLLESKEEILLAHARASMCGAYNTSSLFYVVTAVCPFPTLIRRLHAASCVGYVTTRRAS